MQIFIKNHGQTLLHIPKATLVVSENPDKISENQKHSDVFHCPNSQHDSVLISVSFKSFNKGYKRDLQITSCSTYYVSLLQTREPRFREVINELPGYWGEGWMELIFI